MIRTLKDHADAPGELSVVATRGGLDVTVSGLSVSLDMRSSNMLRSRLEEMAGKPDVGWSLWMSDGLDGLVSHDVGHSAPSDRPYGPGVYRFWIQPKGSRDSVSFCLEGRGFAAFLKAVLRALNEHDVREVMES